MRQLAVLLLFLLPGQAWTQVAVCPLEGDIDGSARQFVADVLTARGYRSIAFGEVDQALPAGKGGELKPESLPILSRSLSSEKIVWGRLDLRAHINLPVEGAAETWELQLHCFDADKEEIESFSRRIVGLSREKAFPRLIAYWGSRFQPTDQGEVRETKIVNMGAGKDSPASPSSRFLTERSQHSRRVVDRGDPTEKDKKMFGFVVFEPPLYNHKRWMVFDSLTADYHQLIRSSELSPVSTENIPPGWQHYHGKLHQVLKAGMPASVPSVSPQMKVASYYPDPAQGIELFRDDADNYYLIADRDTVIDFTYHVGMEPQYTDSHLLDAINWTNFPAGQRVSLPAAVRAKAALAVEHMGLDKKVSPVAIIRDLAAYCRAFDADGEIPRDEPDTYLAITLSKTGVCRHRAFSFFVTANFLGIPTRIVENEIHAFVEVYFPGHGWHRLDLGGGSANVDYYRGTDRVTGPQSADPTNSEGIDGIEADRRQGTEKLVEMAAARALSFLKGKYLPPWTLGIGGVIGLALAIFLAQRRSGVRREMAVQSQTLKSQNNGNEATLFQTNVEFLKRFETAMAAAMRPYPPGTTYREFVVQACRNCPSIASPLKEALHIYEQACYGGFQITPQTGRDLVQLLNAVREKLIVPGDRGQVRPDNR